jgi:hypothetical protein
MVMLDNIVAILAAPYLYFEPLRIFPSKQSKGQMARNMAVQRRPSRPAIAIRAERLAKERLRRRDAAVR